LNIHYAVTPVNTPYDCHEQWRSTTDMEILYCNSNTTISIEHSTTEKLTTTTIPSTQSAAASCWKDVHSH